MQRGAGIVAQLKPPLLSVASHIGEHKAQTHFKIHHECAANGLRILKGRGSLRGTQKTSKSSGFLVGFCLRRTIH